MLTQSQSLNGLLFNEWFVFLLHLFHWLSDAFSSSSPPSIADQYSVLPLCARPPVLTLNPLLPLLPLWREKLETKCILILHLIIFIFSLSDENLPSYQIKYNTIYKVKPNPAYLHMVIPF